MQTRRGPENEQHRAHDHASSNRFPTRHRTSLVIAKNTSGDRSSRERGCSMWPAGEGWIGFGAFGRGAGEVVIARSSRARSMRPKGPFFQNAFRTRASAGSAGRPEYKKIPFCGAFAEPSDGLEPSTLSLPFR